MYIYVREGQSDGQSHEQLAGKKTVFQLTNRYGMCEGPKTGGVVGE